MPQLWQGRASKAVDSRVNDFNSSIRFDARMIEQDIRGSMVHSAMLGRQGIIPAADVQALMDGLHVGGQPADVAGQLNAVRRAPRPRPPPGTSCPATPTCSVPSRSPSATS